MNISINRKDILDYNIISYSCDINIKIRVNGTQKITSNLFPLCPDHVILDGNDIKGSDCHEVDLPMEMMLNL